MTYIDVDRLLDFIEAERAEREAAMDESDPPYVKAADFAYLEGLATVKVYADSIAIQREAA